MIRPIALAPASWQPDPALAAAAGPEPAGAGPDQILPLDPLGARAGALLREGILETPGGLPSRDREVVAMAVARALGCVYTANLHADRFIAAAGPRELAAEILARGSEAPLTARLHALVTFAERMAATPPTATAADFTALRAAGLTDPEIMDALNVSALVSASARLALALGQTLPGS
ncbi:peroxidase-related enzyme [Segnochrobactraceae bacterium EtOH-i3]